MRIPEVIQHITTLYRAGARHTIFLQGEPGIGKSDAGKGAALELKRGNPEHGIEPLPDFDLRQWQATIEDPLELPGLPAIVGGQAKRVPFEDKIPSSGHGILIIDEINSASTLTQASLYSLVWDRKLGGSILGQDWMIIATGNQDKDRAVTQRMPTPLVSRMEHLTVESDYEAWLIWMAVEGGHETVRAFIKYRPNLFVTFKPEIPGPFATARTWKMVSDLMFFYEKGSGSRRRKVTPPIQSIEGWVGKGPAAEFMVYQTMAEGLVDLDTIIKDPNHADCPKDNPGALYAITTGLAGRFNYNNCTNIMTYLERMDKEYAIYCITSAREVEHGRITRMAEEEKKKYKKIRDNKTFLEWCVRNHDFVVEN